MGERIPAAPAGRIATAMLAASKCMAQRVAASAGLPGAALLGGAFPVALGWHARRCVLFFLARLQSQGDVPGGLRHARRDASAATARSA